MRNLSRFFTTTASERAYFDTCADRPALSNTDFHQRFYADSEVTLETCAGVRRVLCEQLKMCNTLPDERACRQLVHCIDCLGGPAEASKARVLTCGGHIARRYKLVRRASSRHR